MKVFGLLHTDSLFNWCKQGHKDNSFSKIFFFLKVAFFFLVFLGGGRVDFILNDLLFFVWFCLVVVVVVGTRTEPRTLYNANEHILYY